MMWSSYFVYFGSLCLIMTFRLSSGIASIARAELDKYQVEIELIRLDNPDGVTSDGRACDPLLGGCDTRIFAYLDWERPISQWPGARTIKPEDLIFQAEDSTPTSVDIRRVLVNHICATPYYGFTLRVNVMDEDRCGWDDLINNFNCKHTGVPAEQREQATWSNITYCEPLTFLPRMSLTFRSRVFRASGPRCPAVSDSD